MKTVLLLLSLASCQTTPSWQVSHIEAHDSARLSYAVRDIVNEIGVEICQVRGQVTTYLEVHSQTIPPYQGNPGEALVKMKIEEKVITGVAKRHEGGQRLTLPVQLQECLMESLKSGKNVTILLKGYSTKLDAHLFQEQYQTLSQKPRKPWINLLS